MDDAGMTRPRGNVVDAQALGLQWYYYVSARDSRKVLGGFVDFVALMMRLSNLKPETPEDGRGQVYYSKLATVCTTGSAPRGTIVWWRQVRQSLRASVNKGGSYCIRITFRTRGPAPSAALRLKDRELQHTGWHTFDWRLGRDHVATDHVATDHVAGSEITLTHGHLGMWLARAWNHTSIPSAMERMLPSSAQM